MSVLRRNNYQSQGRVDVPQMKMVESAVSNDFDQLIQAVITGTSQGYVLNGFEIAMSGAIGGAASGLQVLVASSAILHVTSSQSGTFYLVPSTALPQTLNSSTNTLVTGSFAPNSINYVGIEYQRQADPSTTAQIYLWDPTTNIETTTNAPTAQTLNYTFQINTGSFPSNVLPIATVTTDSNNNVQSITDARSMLFRLGTGGANPNPFHVYPWTAQSAGRVENPSTASTSGAPTPFEGGDKMLFTLKDWMDAIMTSIQEIKGTTYWYSESASGSIESIREDLGNTVVTGRGTITHNATTPGLINWSDDIVLKVVGSELSYTLDANPTSTDLILADEQVAYITLVRGQTIPTNLVLNNNNPVVQSVGSVAWTANLVAGDFIKLGSDTDANYYQITSVDSSIQVTLAEPYAGANSGPGGAVVQYAFGSYSASPTPNSNRNIFIVSRSAVPSTQDTFWLMLRSDNSGSAPKVYVRFLGAELDQGVTEEISDNKSQNSLTYIGALNEASSLPLYVASITPSAVPQITSFVLGAASTISSDQYFYISSSGNSRLYYGWFNKDSAGVDPAPPGAIGIEINISTGNTAAQVAAAFVTALNGTSADDFTAVQQPTPNTNIVIVTNNSAGTTDSPSNFNVPSPFAFTVTQSGIGTGNVFINDGDSLTLAIKKLDEAIASIVSSLSGSAYDETVDVVASGATPPTSITGPVSSGTVITLPNNSRNGGSEEQYTVGKGNLEVFLNGKYLRLGVDWLEVGSASSLSNQIEILINLVVFDSLEFRLSGSGGGAGGGGGVGPQGPPGPTGATGPAGADALNGPVVISTKTSDYTVLSTDGFLKANCTAGPITFTLPSAASSSRVYFFKKSDSSVNAMTIKGAGTETIDGSNTQFTTVQYDSFSVISDGSTWNLF